MKKLLLTELLITCSSMVGGNYPQNIQLILNTAILAVVTDNNSDRDNKDQLEKNSKQEQKEKIRAIRKTLKAQQKQEKKSRTSNKKLAHR